jgi:hypothetical protein
VGSNPTRSAKLISGVLVRTEALKQLFLEECLGRSERAPNLRQKSRLRIWGRPLRKEVRL